MNTHSYELESLEIRPDPYQEVKGSGPHWTKELHC